MTREGYVDKRESRWSDGNGPKLGVRASINLKLHSLACPTLGRTCGANGACETLARPASLVNANQESRRHSPYHAIKPGPFGKGITDAFGPAVLVPDFGEARRPERGSLSAI
jgi:hypothetical protein